MQAALADIAATIIIFLFSSAFRNSSFYVPYWSVAQPLLMIYLMLSYDVFDPRLVLILLLTTPWSIRLTHNWARGRQGLEHVDWRYINLRAKTGIFPHYRFSGHSNISNGATIYRLPTFLAVS